jgi:glutathione S-transferase
MITLFNFGPAFGLVDMSPFVTKAETLLRLSGLPYRTEQGNLRKAPKGKFPYIEDDGHLIGDSTLIRWHLEQKYAIDFNRGLSPAESAAGWAFERTAEDHLYWAVADLYWMDDANFARGPRTYLAALPAAVRPLVAVLLRRRMRARMRAQGMGLHDRSEIIALGSRSVGAIADFLGDKPYFMGDYPTGTDATIFAVVAAALTPHFTGALQQAVARHDNLRRYVGRMAAKFYPEFAEIAGCKPAA